MCVGYRGQGIGVRDQVGAVAALEMRQEVEVPSSPAGIAVRAAGILASMTTREVLRELVERLDDEEVEKLAEIAAAHGLGRAQPEGAPRDPRRFVDARRYPALAAIWNNDDDAIFDGL
jgi:hypothetical protein